MNKNLIKSLKKQIMIKEYKIRFYLSSQRDINIFLDRNGDTPLGRMP